MQLPAAVGGKEEQLYLPSCRFSLQQLAPNIQ